MHYKLLTLAIALSAIAAVHGADPLTSSDIWRIQRGWGARDDAERERWAAAGYDANGRKISDDSESYSASSAKDYSLDRGRAVLPAQEYMGPMDPSSKRLRLFQQGLLPLTRSEAIALLSGEQPTSLADVTIREAFQAARYVLGQITEDELPSSYRNLLRPAALQGVMGTNIINDQPTEYGGGANATQHKRLAGVDTVSPNAYGAGVNADQFGRPHTYRTANGQDVGIFNEGVERDAYGAGVHADEFGRPVYDSAP